MEKHIFRIVFTALAALIYAQSVQAQTTDPSWLKELTWQLTVEKKCEPEFYMNVEEGVVGGRIYYEARVMCTDGRSFDANRINPDLHFTIEPCEIDVC